MTKAEVINEILKVVLHAKSGTNVTLDWIKSEYDEDFAQEIWDYVSNWVNENNVENVEFTLDKESIEDVWGEWKSMNDVTSCKINWVKDYDKIQNAADKAFKDNENGPGWNGFVRDDNRWNEKYFFTGSDCTYYVLVKKI